ncbi:MAG: hypothetical protein E7559_07075 [Ruminococcaceae bacterium]|nr:hypothetical protein [Oscillospiraceae bacterium]
MIDLLDYETIYSGDNAMDERYKKLVITGIICSVLLLASMVVTPKLQPEPDRLYREYDPSRMELLDSGAAVEAAIDPEGKYSINSISGSDAPTYVMVDINHATAEQLDHLLPGIGETLAGRIVEYREITGGFNTVDELTEVKGISDRLLEELRGYIYAG